MQQNFAGKVDEKLHKSMTGDHCDLRSQFNIRRLPVVPWFVQPSEFIE
jgi:hypothetical protein